MNNDTFTAQLMPATAQATGFASGYDLCPSTLAASLLTDVEWSGPWLCCYMLRRFGWPNRGSDDYKELMTWVITTPMEGLYLAVTPYMGCDRDPVERKSRDQGQVSAGSALHFGVRMTDAIQERLAENSPAVKAHQSATEKFVADWWERDGRHRLAFGSADAEYLTKTTMVLRWHDDREHPGCVWGLYELTPALRASGTPERWAEPLPEQVVQSLAESIGLDVSTNGKYRAEDEISMQDMLGMSVDGWPVYDREACTAWRKERCEHGFVAECRAALLIALRDLLKPTSVRDVYFNAMGSVCEDALGEMEIVERWPGAGYTPAAWEKEQTNLPQEDAP